VIFSYSRSERSRSGSREKRRNTRGLAHRERPLLTDAALLVPSRRSSRACRLSILNRRCRCACLQPSCARKSDHVRGQQSMTAMLASLWRSPAAGARLFSRSICSALSWIPSAALFSSTRADAAGCRRNAGSDADRAAIEACRRVVSRSAC
jgi:hypothetical protein